MRFRHHHSRSDDTPYLLTATLFVVASFAGLLGIASPAAQRIAKTYGNVAAVVTAALVDLTNADRAANNVRALAVNPLLRAAAQAKADDMAARGYFAHFDAQGKGPWDWMREAGYVYHFAGENLAIQFTESADVERAWLNSPAHRQNLLDGRFTEVGIATAEGVYEGRPTTFVVQFFGTPAPTIAIRDPEPAPVEAVPIETAPVAATEPQADVEVLGLVTDSTAPVQGSHEAVADTPDLSSSTAATTTAIVGSLLFRPEAGPTNLALVQAAPQDMWNRIAMTPSSVPRLLLAVAAFAAALSLAYAAFREIELWHTKHSFYATSLSAASFAVAFAAVSFSPSAPLLDDQPIAFASSPSAHVAIHVSAEGRPYAVAPAPVQTASAADALPTELVDSLAETLYRLSAQLGF